MQYYFTSLIRSFGGEGTYRTDRHLSARPGLRVWSPPPPPHHARGRRERLQLTTELGYHLQFRQSHASPLPPNLHCIHLCFIIKPSNDTSATEYGVFNSEIKRKIINIENSMQIRHTTRRTPTYEHNQNKYLFLFAFVVLAWRLPVVKIHLKGLSHLYISFEFRWSSWR